MVTKIAQMVRTRRIAQYPVIARNFAVVVTTNVFPPTRSVISQMIVWTALMRTTVGPPVRTGSSDVVTDAVYPPPRPAMDQATALAAMTRRTAQAARVKAMNSVVSVGSVSQPISDAIGQGIVSMARMRSTAQAHLLSVKRIESSPVGMDSSVSRYLPFVMVKLTVPIAQMKRIVVSCSQRNNNLTMNGRLHSLTSMLD